jgi:hypothetical protein
LGGAEKRVPKVTKAKGKAQLELVFGANFDRAFKAAKSE